MAEKLAALQNALMHRHLLDKPKIVALENVDGEFVSTKLHRQAAVLYLVYYFDSRPHVLLTIRAKTVKRFPGDICLPGGHLEQGESVIDAVLREVEEEVGIPKDVITILGTLPVTFGTKNVIVTPCVGILNRDYDPNQLTLCQHEVEGAFWAPSELFVSTASHMTRPFDFMKKRFQLHYFKYLDDKSGKMYSITGLAAGMSILISGIVLDCLPAFPFTFFAFQPQASENVGRNEICDFYRVTISLRLRSFL